MINEKEYIKSNSGKHIRILMIEIRGILKKLKNLKGREKEKRKNKSKSICF
jgi:hypothetical protein